MTVEKIDIEKELLEIPDGRDRMDFIERPALSAYPHLNDGEVPPSIDIAANRKTYFVQKVTHEKDPPKKYLVAIDDKELFQDLMTITDSLLNRAVDKKQTTTEM